MGILDAPSLSPGLARRQLRRQRRPLLSRCQPQNNFAISPAGVEARTYKRQHYAIATGQSLQFQFSNWGNGGVNLGGTPGWDMPGLNAIHVRASYINASGLIVPMTFGSERTVRIAPGAIVVSDPIEAEVTIGQTVYTYTHVSVEEGGSWPLGMWLDPSRNEGWDDADLTTSGAAPANTAAAQSYGPDVCWGLRKYEGSPVIGLLGDSIMADYANNVVQNRNFGWANRALNNQYSYQVLSLPNTGITIAPTVAGYRLRLLEGCDIIICNLGRNGVNRALSQLNTVKAELQLIWDMMVRRGLRVWQTTITPYTTSTDGWLTTTNQTHYTAGAPDQEALRVATNDWIKTTPAPLSGFIDVSAQVESAPDSGLWAANGTANFRTADGIHPTNAGDAALALALDPSIFGPVAQ